MTTMPEKQETQDAEQQPRPTGFEFLRAAAADAIKSMGGTQKAEPEAPEGDVEDSVDSGEATESTPSAAPAKVGKAETRIRELLAKSKNFETQNADLKSKYEATQRELAEYRKEKDLATSRQAILQILSQEGPDEDFSGRSAGGREANLEAMADKVLAAMQSKKSSAGASSTSSRDPEVAALLEERKIITELGDAASAMSPAQLGAVAEIRSSAPQLTVEEALILAQRRRPSLFPESDNRGPDPRLHGTTKPTGRSSSERTPKSDRAKEREHIAAAMQTSGEERLARILAGLSHNPVTQKAFKHINS